MWYVELTPRNDVAVAGCGVTKGIGKRSKDGHLPVPVPLAFCGATERLLAYDAHSLPL